MTRETRIGLVVGFMFIVMFALVLSELTRADSDVPEVGAGGSTYVEDESPIVEVIDGFTSRPVPPPMDDPGEAVAAAEDPGATPLPPARAAAGTADHGKALPSLSAVDEAGWTQDAEVVPVEPDPAPGGADRLGVSLGPPPESPGPSAGPPPGPVEPPGHAGATPSREAGLRHGASHGAAASPAEPAVVASPSQPGGHAHPLRSASGQGMAPRGTYVVKPGDNLTNIARRTLGDESRAAVRKILDANRDRIGDPDVLPVGLELVIPAAERAADRPAAPPVRSAYYRRALEDLAGEIRKRQVLLDPNRPADALPMPRAGARRVYRVRRGDNLTKIAREVLRDGSRSAVRRIVEANKSKIKDPDVLPVGVELVIPS